MTDSFDLRTSIAFSNGSARKINEQLFLKNHRICLFDPWYNPLPYPEEENDQLRFSLAVLNLYRLFFDYRCIQFFAKETTCALREDIKWISTLRGYLCHNNALNGIRREEINLKKGNAYLQIVNASDKADWAEAVEKIKRLTIRIERELCQFTDELTSGQDMEIGNMEQQLCEASARALFPQESSCEMLKAFVFDYIKPDCGNVSLRQISTWLEQDNYLVQKKILNLEVLAKACDDSKELQCLQRDVIRVAFRHCLEEAAFCRKFSDWKNEVKRSCRRTRRR